MKTSHERGEQKRFLQLFINPFKAAQGQRVLSPADFKGEARALKFREEPIFEAAVACEAVIFYQAVTAGGGKNFCHHPAAGVEYLKVAIQKCAAILFCLECQ